MIGIAVGDATGFPLLELPGYVQLILFFSYAAIAIPGLLAWAGRLRRVSFASHWYAAAALFLFPWILSIAHVMLFSSPARGVMQPIIAGWYAQSAWTLWLAPLALSVGYFVVPKVTGRVLPSYEFASLGFWCLVFVGGLTGGRHLLGGPVPAWIPSVAVVSCALLFFHTFVVLLNLRGAFSLQGTALKFIAFGIAAYVAGAVLDAITSFHAVALHTQFTYFDEAQKQIALYGAATSILFGGVYFALPRITGKAWLSPMLVWAHLSLRSSGSRSSWSRSARRAPPRATTSWMSPCRSRPSQRTPAGRSSAPRPPSAPAPWQHLLPCQLLRDGLRDPEGLGAGHLHRARGPGDSRVVKSNVIFFLGSGCRPRDLLGGDRAWLKRPAGRPCALLRRLGDDRLPAVDAGSRRPGAARLQGPGLRRVPHPAGPPARVRLRQGPGLGRPPERRPGLHLSAGPPARAPAGSGPGEPGRPQAHGARRLRPPAPPLCRADGMPTYRFLFETRQIGVGGQPSEKALKLSGALEPKAGFEIVPTPRAESLVAYLLSL